MSELVISGLRAGVAGREILQGIDLVVRSGEVHAVMGPNGSGKSTLSHVIMGRPGYEVLGGTVTLDGVDLLGAADRGSGPRPGCSSPCSTRPRCPACRSTTCSRRRWSRPAGRRRRRCAEPHRRRGRAHRVRRPLPRPAAQRRPLGRREEAQRDAAARRARARRIAILDEIDSGLDVDALRAVQPPHRGGDQRARPRRARHHPLQPAAPRAAARPRARARPWAHRARPGGPELAMSSRAPVTPTSASMTKRGAQRPDPLADLVGRSFCRAGLTYPRRPMRVRIGIACVVAALAIVAGVVLWPKGGKAATRASKSLPPPRRRRPRRRPRRRHRTRSKQPMRSSPRSTSTTRPARPRRPARCPTRPSSTCRSRSW